MSLNKLFRTFLVSTLLGSGLVLGSASLAVADTQAVPSAPTNVTVSAKTQSSVSLSWTAANDNGSAVTDYRIEFSDDGTNWTVFNDGVSANTSATVTGLARGGGYVFRVSAINANGVGLSALSMGIRQISSSSVAAHTCIVRADQSLWCWGWNSRGQVGNGSTSNQSVPIQIVASGVRSVATGREFTCILKTDSSVWCWGRGDFGQLGSGNNADNRSAVQVSALNDAKSISAGDAFACAVHLDGTVSCWGRNSNGQLGDGSYTDSYVPVVVKGLVNVSSVVAGESFACATLTTGNVKCWGNNISGQLGNGNSVGSSLPVSVSGLDGVKSISAGRSHVCALRSDLGVSCWGRNDFGQLGTGPNVDRSLPVQIPGLTNVARVESGGQSSCANLLDGSVKCWGLNNPGQLGDGTKTNRSTPVSVTGISDATNLALGDVTSCYVLTGNTVKCVGQGNEGELGNNKSKDQSSAGGYWSYCCWRPYDYDEQVPVLVSNFATLDSLIVVGSAPDAPVAPVVGLKTKIWTALSWTAPDNGGQVITNYRVRYSSNGGLTWTIVPDALLTRDSATSLSATVRGLTPATNYVFQVAAANAEGFGPWSASSVVGNTSTVPSAPTNVTVAAKTQSSVSLSWTAASDNGSAVTDYRIEFSDDGTNWSVFNDGVSANTNATVTGLARSGGYVFRVSAINANGAGLSGLALGAKMMTSSSSAGHFCVLKADQSVWCWGRNDYGQLAIGSSPAFNGGFAGGTATAVQSWPAGSASSVATGQDFTCVSTPVGTVKCVGRGDSGQLGNSSSNNSTSVVSVTGLSNATSVAAGQSFACALLSDATVQCWGNNDWGQLGSGSNSSSNQPVPVKGLINVASIAAGDTFACAVLTNRTVKCWGRGAEGQIGNGGNLNTNVPLSVSGLENVQSVALGGWHACAVLTDSTVKCWGANDRGSLGDGTLNNRNVPVQVSGIADAVNISAGKSTSCASLINGVVKCWGQNNIGQLGNGTQTDTSSIPTSVMGLSNAGILASADQTSCVLLTDNKLRCWGRGKTGQLDDGVFGRVDCCWWQNEYWSTTPRIGTDFATLDALFVSRTVPGVPTNVRPISRSGTNATISWSPPTEDGTRVITQYKIQISANYGGTWSDVNAENLSRTSLTATTAQISGLVANTSYGYRVAAVNAIGTGEWGSYTTPSAPRQLRIISQNADSVTVGWVSPEYSGGEIITGYEYSTNGGRTWAAIPGGSSVSAYKITNLDATNPYQVKVRALSFLGVGESSTTLIVQLDPLPQAPVINSILAANGQVRLQISWSPLDTQENYTDRQYSINDGQDWQSFANSSGPYSISGLVNEQEYVIRVRAVNSAGAGAASDSALAHPTRLVPVRPVIASVAAGDSSAIVRMTVPTDYSAQSVTGYQYSIDRGKTFQLAQVSDNSFSIPGLVNGKQTVIIVAAINFNGTSALSLPKTVIPASVPSAPNVSNGVAVLGSISVSVTTPDSGGRPISYFECSTDNGIVWKKCFNVRGSIKLTGLPNGVQHQIKVRAVNAMGPGTASDTYEISTPMSVPGLPKVAWVAKNSNSITLDVVAPATDGGSGITGYAYSIDDRTWVVAGALVNGNQIVIDGLKSNKTYPVRIAAVNAIGRGLGTFRINITTLR